MRTDGVLFERSPCLWEPKFYCWAIFRHTSKDEWFFSFSKSCTHSFEEHKNPFGSDWEFYAITHQTFAKKDITTLVLKEKINLETVDFDENNTVGFWIESTPEVVIMRLLRETHFTNEKRPYPPKKLFYDKEFLSKLTLSEILKDYRSPKPIAKPRKTTPLMKKIQGLPPELQEDIYKKTVQSTLKARERAGWKKVHFEFLDSFQRFYCEDQGVHIKAWDFRGNLICLACLCKKVSSIHSFGNYQEQRDRIRNNNHYREKILDWVAKQRPQSSYFDDWLKETFVTWRPLNEFYFKESLGQLA